MNDIQILPVADIEKTEIIADLSEILLNVVRLGANVNYLPEVTPDECRKYWLDDVCPAVRGGGRALFVAFADGRAVGSVQLALDTPPNQSHRADVLKLIVHPSYQKRGIGRTLMEAIERRAEEEGRWMLFLVTQTNSAAENLYRSLGYHSAGSVENYCWIPSQRKYEPASFLYKMLKS